MTLTFGNLRREIFAATALILAFFVPTGANAEPHRFDQPKEMFLLPEYCKYTQDFREHVPGGNNKMEIERWTESMGPTFIHMHHYCYGLQAINRAQFMSRTREDRTHNLGVSIREFDYVIERATPDFAMLPELFAKRGESLIQLDKPGEGMADLRHAIDLKADYWPAYAIIGDYYKDVGDTAKAREWLQKGLAARPNTFPLKRRLSALDGAQGKQAASR